MKKIFTLLALMVAIGASAEITEVDLNEGSNIKVILGANFNNVDSLKVTGYLSHSNLEKIAWQTRSKIRYLDLGDCEVENNEIETNEDMTLDQLDALANQLNIESVKSDLSNKQEALRSHRENMAKAITGGEDSLDQIVELEINCLILIEGIDFISLLSERGMKDRNLIFSFFRMFLNG